MFCLLTPQSKAKVCWEVVKNIKKKSLLFCNDKEELSKAIHPIRFKNKKAGYIIGAKEIFYLNDKFSIKKVIKSLPDNISARTFFVNKIKGIGFKEASHFLRNIGFGQNIAILDRHILKNLMKYNIIDTIPNNLSEKKYLEIENKMKDFSALTSHNFITCILVFIILGFIVFSTITCSGYKTSAQPLKSCY